MAEEELVAYSAGKKTGFAALLALGLGLAALLLAPVLAGQGLRAKAGAARLAQDPAWAYAALPALSVAWSKAKPGGPCPGLTAAARLVPGYKGKSPELSWAALAMLQARCGRRTAAPASWQRALSFSPRSKVWLKTPAGRGLAQALGRQP